MRATYISRPARHRGDPANYPCVRVSRRLLVCSLSLAALSILVPSSEASAATVTEAFVQSHIDKSYAVLNGDESKRQAEFRALLQSMVDIKRVALFTLGPYARDASQDDLTTFLAAFTGLLAAVYQRGLETYQNGGLEVVGSTERSPGDVIVNVVAGSHGPPASQVRMDFRVRRQPDGGNVVTDLQVEGVWLALMQREEFLAYLQRHHGSIAELSSEVERRVEQTRSASKKIESRT